MKANIGVSGTGYIARQLFRAIHACNDLQVANILTRRAPDALPPTIARDLLTNSLQHFIASCDLVVECSGHPLHAADVVMAAFERGLPVVTMNTEFHVTCGSAFVAEGWISEAEGDQPGCTAALARELQAMRFNPVVYGNMKGFLNHDPSADEMAYWANRQGISLEQVTAFTDGSKIQMEQALIANGFEAHILCQGLRGLKSSDRMTSAMQLAQDACNSGVSIADYVLGQDLPAGVFIVATCEASERDAMRYLKMGDGPFYYFERRFHLCGMEIPKTIRAALRGQPPLLNNGLNPTIGVAAIAKRHLPSGHTIKRGLGGFDLRGEAVRFLDAPDHVPLGLLFNAELTRDLAPGHYVTWDDVTLPPSLATTMARTIAGL
jgi:predicted homoserine dehydrogenase-like protein